MIPIMLPNGHKVFCGPQQKKIHLQHCPACGDREVIDAVAPAADQIRCPACGPTDEFWRLLDRSRS